MAGRRPAPLRSLVWIRDSSTPLFVINVRRQVVSFNHGCELLTGWTAADVLGRRVDSVTEEQPDTPQAVLAALAPPGEVWQGSPCQLPVLMPQRTADPVTRPVQFWPIRDPEGAIHVILGIVGEIPDIAGAQPSTLAQQMHAELAALRQQLRARYGSGSLIGASPAMRRVLEQVRVAQQSAATVLIVGEPGVGKEHLARVIHHGGPLARRTFVRFDCRLTPPFEMKRALRLAGEQDAERDSDPALQPGSLFFADVAAAPTDVLERLQEWLASPREHVRVIASSPTPLELLVADDRFPEPLWYQLSALTIAVPPLRDRPDDLRPLAQFFLEERNRETTQQISGFDDDVWQQMERYRWPGNLDELAAVIDEARAVCTEEFIRPAHLPFRFRTGVDAQRLGPPPKRTVVPLEQRLEQVEREEIAAALAEVRGSVSLAAERLGINRARLYRRMEALGLRGGEAD
jgi:transcriptional regulator with PAS, ATPase and Fis domain